MSESQSQTITFKSRSHEHNKLLKFDTSNIPEYVWLGLKDMNWYQECEQTFREIFGDDKIVLVTRLFAATSINTSLKSNITLFRKAFYEIENKLPIGDYLPNIKMQLEQIRSGRDLTGRKIRSFARAMSGDADAVVVDIWLLRAFNLDRKYFRSGGPHGGRFRSGGATDKIYTQIEDWIRREARKRDIEPRQLSSMIWAGMRTKTNGIDDTRYSSILRSRLQNLFKVI
jgi:hypothetical protein